jgi:hypothetical protein
VTSDTTGQAWVPTDRGGNAIVRMGSGSVEPGFVDRLAVISGSGWWLPNGASGSPSVPVAWAPGATGASLSVTTVASDGRATNRSTITILGDASAPSAALEPLAVEQGNLVLRWRDTDGDGSGIATRAIRLEAAAATATGCGPFRLAKGLSLDPGDDGRGVVSLGPAPSSGCLRPSLVLADVVGHTSVSVGAPYRVVPRAPASAPTIAATVPRWSGRFNLYREAAFVTQKRFTWCVAAAVQMMVNLVRNHTDRTVRTQARMIEYAQRWDNGPYGEDGGTDVTGWIAALRHFGAGRYRVVGSNTAAGALRIAATAIRQTGRPAGLLVMEGRHAWVIHGFESRTDPARDTRASIRAVRVSGPLYPVQQKAGYDPHPNSRFTVRALRRWFTPATVGTMPGRYVVVVPVH